MEKTPIYVCGDCAAALVALGHAVRLGADDVPTIGSSQVCEVHPSHLSPNATSAIAGMSAEALHAADVRALAEIIKQHRVMTAPAQAPAPPAGTLATPWGAPVILQLGPKTEIMMRLIAAWSASEKGANADAYAVDHAAMIADQILAHTHGA